MSNNFSTVDNNDNNFYTSGDNFIVVGLEKLTGENLKIW
jgi:hypothetical protein